MTRLVQIVAGFALLGAVMAPAAVRADNQDVIDYRKHIMKTLGEQAASLGQILQQKVPGDNFAAHAQILAITAASAKKAFEPKVPGGDAKPEVWAKWDDFSKKMDEFAAGTAALAKAAQDGGMAAAGPKVKDALTCKGCHDVYKEPPKK